MAGIIREPRGQKVGAYVCIISIFFGVLYMKPSSPPKISPHIHVSSFFFLSSLFSLFFLGSIKY